MSLKQLLNSTIFVFLLSVSALANDFPNYFKELLPPRPADGSAGYNLEDTKAAERKLEEAVFSIIQRLELPYVDSNGLLTQKGLFQEIEKRAKAADPQAEVYLAGGVVRSLLGYIYSKVYTAKQKDPHVTTAAVLDRIIRPRDPLPWNS